MKKNFLLPLLILLVIGFILAGCSSPATLRTPLPLLRHQHLQHQHYNTAPTTSAPTTSRTRYYHIRTCRLPRPSPLVWSPTLPPASVSRTRTCLTSSLTMTNAKGGLKIGNDTYMMKCICYSDDGDINKGISADNRLVFQDKVQYIINHSPSSDSVLPITDPAKVIDFSNAAIWNSGFLDKWHYAFSLLGQGTHEVSVAGWLAENYPEMKGPNGLAMAFPDNSMGHIAASLISYPYKAIGCQPQIIYYPADQRDLSSLGTKIKTLNPAWLSATPTDGSRGYGPGLQSML